MLSQCGCDDLYGAFVGLQACTFSLYVCAYQDVHVFISAEVSNTSHLDPAEVQLNNYISSSMGHDLARKIGARQVTVD